MPKEGLQYDNGIFRISTSERLSRLEEQVSEIRTNHLFHLSQDIADLRRDIQEMRVNQSRYLGGGAVIIFLSQMLFAYIISHH